MCGIAGIINFNGSPVNKGAIKRMTDVIAHRGPDGEGHWISENHNIAFGHRRLSIIDLSEGGAQPMHYANNRYTITFNGEIYNYIELRKELEKKGYNFISNSDTEVLLGLYSELGEKCLSKLDGMFSFAIWDEKEKSLFCARDRFGEKPFYYYFDNDKFLFGSEIKCLFQAGVEKTINTSRAYDYLFHNKLEDYYSNQTTYFENITQLPPAHFIKINSNNQVLISKYWDINLNHKSHLNHNEIIDQFQNLLNTSIERRLRSDVSVGSSLSGGLDSSTIVALVSKLKSTSQEQKTFSARFKGFERDEGTFISEVVKQTKNVKNYETWPDSEKIFDSIFKVFYHQDEPFQSTSIISIYEVMKLAYENNTTVILDGQGADEILAGYQKYYDVYIRELYLNNRSKYNEEIKNCFQIHEFNPSLSFKNIIGLKFPRLSELKNSFSLSKVHFNTPKETNVNLNESLKYSTLSRGLETLLRYEDRNSMAFSREVRLPFLSHELVEFVFSLPNEYKINNGWTKYVLRLAMDNELPKNITWRKDKNGYLTPQQKWLGSNNFVDLIKTSQQTLINQGLISKDYIVNSENSWRIIMLGLLYKNDYCAI